MTQSSTDEAGRPAEGPANGAGPPTWERSRWQWFVDLLKNWGPAILAVIVIRTFIFEPFRIPSGSMVPTLLIGDHVLVTKFSYGVWLPFVHTELVDLGDPERGDVIVFRYPRDPSLNYIKRVVGIPGDRIRVQNNQIVLDDVLQPREYQDRYTFVDDRCRDHTTKRYVEILDGHPHEMLTNTGMGGSLANYPAAHSGQREIVVPEDHVFVMGDNRDNSEDGRKWGFVRYDQIKGKAHFVWLSWNHCSDGEGWIRSERFFHGLYGPEWDASE